MKILLCTFSFSQIAHGPAKFANLILDINKFYPEHTIKVLTEDVDVSTDEVYKMDFDIPRVVHGIQDFLRGYYYHRRALEIHKEYPYDVIIYNHALQAYWSASWMPETIKVAGMLNDSEHIEKVFIKKGNLLRKQIIHTFLRWAELWTVRKADLIITNSKSMQQLITAEYQPLKNNICVLYKSIKIESIKFKNYRFQSNDLIRVLFVKSDYKRGGLRELVDALAILDEYVFELIIVGPAQGVKDQVLEYIKQSENIHIAYRGGICQEDVFIEMSSADILCVPSLREALGVINIEGLAAGIPVVSTSSLGIREVLDDGNNGWLAKPGDVKDLAEKLRQCILSPSERIEKSTKGRAFVQENFSSKKMFSNFINILSRDMH